MNSLWDIFKSSIYKACESLPPASKSSDPDWVTDELHNLSKKKQKAWVSLKNAPLQDNSCPLEYNHLKKLTRVAAEKARNSWWSARAAEAERRAQIAEQQGRGGSLIKDLRLLHKKFSKPASFTLVAEDGTILQSDRDKLNRWVEHFAEVVNCQVNTAVVPIDDLPVVSSLSNTSSSLSDTDMSAPLSEEEIITAISELNSGKAPGLDGISLEMLSLGEDATIYWLNLF